MPANLPLPTTQDSVAVYDREGEPAWITLRPDGSYYGHTGRYDFTEPTADAMRARLAAKGFQHVGWERADEE